MSTDTRCEWSDLPPETCACPEHRGDDRAITPGDMRVSEPAPARRVEQAPDTTLEQPRLPSTWAPSANAGECRCGRPTRDDAWVCDQCAETFSHTLADLGALDIEVQTTMTRLRGLPTQGGSRAAEKPLPWHDKAAEARRVLNGLLSTWVRFCEEEEVRGPGSTFPADTIASKAAWLETRVAGLALMDIGPECVDEITDAAAECHRLVFWKRRSRIYLGPCGVVQTDDEGVDSEPCPGDVYADEGEPVGFCEECGQGVTVAIRRSNLDRELDDRLCTAAEIARLATFLGLDRPRETVRNRVNQWHKRGRVKPSGATVSGEPLFRYGAVRGMLYADFGRDTA